MPGGTGPLVRQMWDSPASDSPASDSSAGLYAGG